MEVSPVAAMVITDLVRARGAPDAGFRIRRDADRADSEGLRVGYAIGPLPHDTIVERDGARVFVDDDAEALVAALTLDVAPDGPGYRFVLR